MLALTQLIGSDKIEHFLIFTTVSFLAATFAFFLTPISNAFVRMMTTNATLSLVGIIEEYRQYFDPHHTPELLDAISDICGVIVGSSPLFVMFFFWRLFHRRKQAAISATPVFLISLVTTGGLLYGLSFISQTPSHTKTITVTPQIAGDHSLPAQDGNSAINKADHPNSYVENKRTSSTPTNQNTTQTSPSHTESGQLSKIDEITKIAAENDKRLSQDRKPQNNQVNDGTSEANNHGTNQGNSTTATNAGNQSQPTSHYPLSQHPSAAAIVKQHKPQFQALEQKTTVKVNTLYNQAMNDYESKKQSNKIALLFLFNKYKNEASQIETQTDQTFQKLYASLQTDLTDHGYDPTIAKPIKTEFIQQKAATRKALLQKALGAFLGGPSTNSADQTNH